MQRKTVPTGNPWGDIVGYSRAVRAGDLVVVSGTAATGRDGSALHPDDAAAQTRVVLDRIVAALRELGARPEHVIETCIYVTDIAAHWEAVGRAHGAVFGVARPASTMVEVSALIAPGLLVEISATASLAGDRT